MTINRRKFNALGAGLLVGAAVSNQVAAGQGSNDLLLLDDMSSLPMSSYGGRWGLSTDRVMGGVSDGQASAIIDDGRNAIHLTGSVSTANNGGFVQVSMRLRPRLNASNFTGIELDVKGDGHPYWVHLRDRNTPFPWQVYNASYETNGRWQTVRVPFSNFRPYHRSRNSLDPTSLNNIGMVAGFDDFQANLMIGRVALYR